MERTDYIDLVEKRYFGRVSAGDVDGACACFTGDAEILILHGDHPPRRFYAQPPAGEQHLTAFWRHLCDHFTARFDRFEHVVDTEAARCACTFTVTLTPKPDSPYVERGTLTLRNCNFFWLCDGKIARMVIYYANPDSGGDPIGRPTGYPPKT
ncbi:MAG: nuclear transport factor 2 family protein [Steroidobacteraceae bacterium]|nr:nuclear transport factor 2 family protein [Steroidobacteraceae bacterium]MDW8259034.1 nuclear transport factor 2 family protein [Gammaproteobacteria bacterium]